jgi:ribosome biogenesis protein Nip4
MDFLLQKLERMQKLMEFRKPNRVEKTILRKAFSKWGIFEYYDEINIFIKISETTPKDKKVYICSKPFESLDTFLGHKLISLGLQLGIIRKKKFIVGLNFAELVLEKKKNERFDFPHVVVTEKAVNLVCFGRDVMGNSVVSCSEGIDSNQILIIINKNHELVGMGRTRYTSELLLQPNLVTVDTVENIGTYYLQEENLGLE